MSGRPLAGCCTASSSKLQANSPCGKPRFAKDCCSARTQGKPGYVLAALNICAISKISGEPKLGVLEHQDNDGPFSLRIDGVISH